MIESFKDTNNNSIINPNKTQEELNEDFSLRPKHFTDFVGQKNIIDNLNIIDNSSKENSSKIYPLKKKDKNFLISNLLIENSKAVIKYQKNIKDLHIDLSSITFNNVGNARKEKDNNFQHYKDAIKLILTDIFFKIPDYKLRKLIKENYKIG